MDFLLLTGLVLLGQLIIGTLVPPNPQRWLIFFNFWHCHEETMMKEQKPLIIVSNF